MGRLRQLYQAHKDEVAFLFVYVADGLHDPPELQDVFEQAGVPVETSATHCRRAQLGVEALDLPFPCVIDTPDAKVQKLYDAYPERLVILGRDGSFVFDGGKGVNPSQTHKGWDFDKLEAALASLAHRVDGPTM